MIYKENFTQEVNSIKKPTGQKNIKYKCKNCDNIELDRLKCPKCDGAMWKEKDSI